MQPPILHIVITDIFRLIVYYIKCIPYLPFNCFKLAIKCLRPQAEHICYPLYVCHVSKYIPGFYDWFKSHDNVKLGFTNGSMFPSGGVSKGGVCYERGYPV